MNGPAEVPAPIETVDVPAASAATPAPMPPSGGRGTLPRLLAVVGLLALVALVLTPILSGDDENVQTEDAAPDDLAFVEMSPEPDPEGDDDAADDQASAIDRAPDATADDSSASTGAADSDPKAADSGRADFVLPEIENPERAVSGPANGPRLPPRVPTSSNPAALPPTGTAPAAPTPAPAAGANQGDDNGSAADNNTAGTNDGSSQQPAAANPGAAATVPAGQGLTFQAGYPYVNENGTYYSTLGAPASVLRWEQSTKLLWNQPLPDDTPAVYNSATIAQQVDDIVHGNRIVSWGSALETEKNAPYVLLVDGNREDFVYVESKCGNLDYFGWGWYEAETEQYINNAYPGRVGVPMPADFAMDADDGDFAVTVYDYANDVLYDFWQFKSSNLTGGNPQTCWAGILHDYAGDSDGIFPYPVGGSAAGLTATGTIITLEDLRRGSIDHALSVSTLQIYNNKYADPQGMSASWPAIRNDGFCTGTPNPAWDSAHYQNIWNGVGNNPDNCLREGQRLRLPADFDTSTISDPLARMVAEAARDYGIIVHDFGGCFCIQGESGRVTELNGFGVNPWDDAYNGTAPHEIMYAIPWDQIEVLPVDWGKPAGYERPCISNYAWIEGDQTCERSVAPYAAD